MGIKQRFKGIWSKLRKKTGRMEAADDIVKTPTDSEISAEEVVEREVFPKPKTACGKSKAEAARVAVKVAPRTAARKRADAEIADDPSQPAKKQCGKSKPAKRICGGACGKGKKNGTRPTNPDYEMIDPDGNTCDSSQS